MNDTLEIIRSLFQELSDSNAMSELDYDGSDPMASYYGGKAEAYKLAAERIEMAIDLNKVSSASTFEGDV